MIAPKDSSLPRLAQGCRLSIHQGSSIVLYPEGMIRLDRTAQDILRLCDGQHTLEQILAILAQRYTGANPVQMREDVGSFLGKLKDKRIVDYE